MGEHIESQMQEMFLKGNEKIAKFMGAKPAKTIFGRDGYEHENWWHYVWVNAAKDNIETNVRTLDELKYHSSWDWLKPVIDKIINMIGVKTVDECTDEEWRYYTMISRMWIGVTIVEAWVLVEDFMCFYYSGRCSLNKD